MLLYCCHCDGSKLIQHPPQSQKREKRASRLRLRVVFLPEDQPISSIAQADLSPRSLDLQTSQERGVGPQEKWNELQNKTFFFFSDWGRRTKNAQLEESG